MRKWIAGLTIAAVAACSGGERMSSDLNADLAALSSASALELASTSANAAAVVSAQEQTAPRATTQAPSARAPRPRPSPAPTVRAAPRPEPQAQPEVDFAAATPQPLPQPTENRGFDGMGEGAIVTGRPQVVDAAPVSRGGGGGSEIGAVLGGIGIAVIRGGVVFGDVHCPPPRRRARDGGLLALPNRSGSGGVQMTVRGITIR